MILYHRTHKEAAHAILRGGFRDGIGSYGTPRLFAGVWFSDRPLTPNEGAHGDTLLRVVLPVGKGQLRRYEWVESGKPFREWQIPAAMLNPRRVSVVPVWRWEHSANTRPATRKQISTPI